MQFTRLRLRNFKCFEETDVNFTNGATVIHGVNGSGKSSLLDACFFALYGTDSLPAGKKLESVITKGAERSEIELWFEHLDHQYHLEREIRRTDSQVIHDGVLKTPETVVDGITALEDTIEEILRMDAEAFLNCAYVRQGDITRLLTASPADRQGMIDELLQLGKLETYRERMDQARRGLDRVRRNRASKLEDIRDSIGALESKDLDSRLETVSQRISELNADRSEVEDSLDEAKADLESVEAELEEYSEKESELDAVRADLEERRAELDSTKERRDDLKDQVTEQKAVLETLEANAASLIDQANIEYADDIDPAAVEDVRRVVQDEIDRCEHRIEELTDEIETVRADAQSAAAERQRLIEAAETLETEAANHDERREDLLTEIEQKEREIEDTQRQLMETHQQLEDHRAEFRETEVPNDVEPGDAATFLERVETTLGEHRNREQSLVAEIEAVAQQVEHAERLIAEGKCPECGQDVEDAPEVESLGADRERLSELESTRDDVQAEIDDLETRRDRAVRLKETEAAIDQLEHECDSLEALLEEQRAGIAEKRDTAEELAEMAADRRDSAAEKRAEAEQLEAERDEYLAALEDRQAEKDTCATALEELRDLEQCLDRIDQTGERITGLTDQVQDVESLLDKHREAVAELETKKTELEAALDEQRMSTLTDQREAAADRVDELKSRLSAVRAELNELAEERGELRAEQNRLTELRERRDALETQTAALGDVVSECSAIQELYGALRTELRRQNVRQLEFLLNEIFAIVYQNDAYARIELSDEYDLRVHEKSGEELLPDELSGGEKALFNLSLRCAIYQLLAEGIGTEAPLPPLILDEPTVHLDAEHINRISDLVNRMRRLGVEQTIVVSHEAEIVDSADERIEIIQNPSTNRSRVNVESTDLLRGITESPHP